MGESSDRDMAPDLRVEAERAPETAEDEFYHQAVILDRCFDPAGLSPRMKEMLARMAWERTTDAAKRAHRQPRRSA